MGFSLAMMKMMKKMILKKLFKVIVKSKNMMKFKVFISLKTNFIKKVSKILNNNNNFKKNNNNNFKNNNFNKNNNKNNKICLIFKTKIINQKLIYKV